MNSTHSCFDADCMVHFYAFIKGYSDPALASTGRNVELISTYDLGSPQQNGSSPKYSYFSY